jgi:hypothetical protein
VRSRGGIDPADDSGRELESIVDNIGLPTSGINVSYNNGGTIGPFDAEILISLNREKHHPTEGYIRKLRHDLNHDFSRRFLLFSTGGHREPGFELRAALAD